MKKILAALVLVLLMIGSAFAEESDDVNAVIIGGADGPTAIYIAGEENAPIPDSVVYEYEGEGIGGMFTICFFEDGTYLYSEGPASSYIGIGEWTEDPETMIVTLKEDEQMCGSARLNRFMYVDEQHLQWVAESSDNFAYVTLEDGATFRTQPEQE